MSYLNYKPLNKRFKEFIGILVIIIVSGFIGMIVAVVKSGITDYSVTSLGENNVFTYGFIGAIIGLILGVFVVNSSQDLNK